MADGASVTVTGGDGISIVLKGLAAGFQNPRDLLMIAGGAMKGQVVRTFNAAKDPISGAPWPPTSQFTLSLRPGGGGGGKTLRDSNQLFNSLVSAVPQISGNTVSLTTNKVYAAMQNYGGTIRPRNTKYLAIPLTREAKRAGSAKRWMEQNSSLRPFFFQRSSQEASRIAGYAGFKTVFIATREGTGKAARLVFHFVLKESVEIPQRRFLGWGEAYVKEILTLLDQYIARKAEEKGGLR